jgi:hypothetical protein
MFARLYTLFQLRRSTAFLLLPQNERLLDDIGLDLGALMELRRDGGRTRRAGAGRLAAFLPFVRDIPVTGRG